MTSKENISDNSQNYIDDDLITVDEWNEESSNLHSNSSDLQTIDQCNESEDNVEWDLMSIYN